MLQVETNQLPKLHIPAGEKKHYRVEQEGLEHECRHTDTLYLLATFWTWANCISLHAEKERDKCWR